MTDWVRWAQQESDGWLAWGLAHWWLPVGGYVGLFVLLLIVRLGRGTPTVRAARGDGQVKWAHRWQLWWAGCFAREGMVLGVAQGWWWRPYIRAPREHSVAVIMAPGEGKSRGPVMGSLLGCPEDSFVVIDPSGELVKETADFRRRCGQVFVWNPLDPASARWNVWTFIRWGTSAEDADVQRLASHVVEPLAEHSSGGAEHYERVADSSLALGMRYVAYTRPRQDHHFGALLSLFATVGQTPQKLLAEMVKHPHPRIRDGASLLLKETGRKLQDDWNAAVEWLRRWEDVTLALTTSETTIPWMSLQYGLRPVTIYLVVTMDDLKNRLHRDMRMRFDLLLHQMSALILHDARGRPRHRRHTNIIPDDVGAMGDFPPINDIPVEKRKYHIHLMAPFQASTQADSGRYSGLLNSCQSWVIGWQGEPDSADYVERKIAERTVLERQESETASRWRRGWTRRWARRQEALMPSGAIHALRPDEIVLCIRHLRYRGRRLIVNRDRNFRRLMPKGG